MFKQVIVFVWEFFNSLMSELDIKKNFYTGIILHLVEQYSGGSRIFPGGAPTPKIAIIFQIFAENCMKMKEFGLPGGGARVPSAPLRSANAIGSTTDKLQLKAHSPPDESGNENEKLILMLVVRFLKSFFSAFASAFARYEQALRPYTLHHSPLLVLYAYPSRMCRGRFRPVEIYGANTHM